MQPHGASTGNLKSSPRRAPRVLLQQICKLSRRRMPHAQRHTSYTNTHTHTHALSFLLRHDGLWLANWLASALWLRQNLAGWNWKMGSPLFSPLGWTKDQTFLRSRSNSKRWSTRCPSGWITTVECACLSPLEWQWREHKKMMAEIEWGRVIPICVGSYLFVRGQGGGGGL